MPAHPQDGFDRWEIDYGLAIYRKQDSRLTMGANEMDQRPYAGTMVDFFQAWAR